MKYAKQFQELKADFLSAKEKTNQAGSSIQEAEKALTKQKQIIPELHEDMIEAKAKAEAGEGEEKHAEEAKKRYTKALEELEKLKVDLEVKKRVLPKRKDQEKSSFDDFQEIAKVHYSQKALPILERLENAVSELDEALNESEGLFDKIKKLGLRPLNYLPAPLSDVVFDISGQIRKERMNQYVNKIQNLKQKNHED